MENSVAAALISLTTLTGWLLALGCIYAVRFLPRAWFVAAHYGLDILIFGGLFWLLSRWAHHFSAFATMAIAMLTLFLIEYVYWNYIYAGSLWFFNFVDWIVPAFLIASVVYGVSR